MEGRELWSVCQIRPNQLTIALANLHRQGFTTFNPVFTKKKLYRSKWVVVQEALFTGYVFVELLPDQRWVPINSTFGVSRLLTRLPPDSEYREPCAIADNFIHGLQGCCCQHADDKTPWRLDPGTKVRILRGPFAQYEGTIASWSSSNRCRLLVWMLNRDVAVEVSVGDIAAVAAEA